MPGRRRLVRLTGVTDPAGGTPDYSYDGTSQRIKTTGDLALDPRTSTGAAYPQWDPVLFDVMDPGDRPATVTSQRISSSAYVQGQGIAPQALRRLVADSTDQRRHAR